MQIFDKSEPLCKELEEEVEVLMKKILPEKKQCYWNARSLARNSKGKFQYYEGAACSENGNFCHAWNMYKDHVIDITPNSDGNPHNIGALRPKWRYCGWPFEISKVQEKDTQIGSVKGSPDSENNGESKLSMLTKEQRIEAKKALIPKHFLE